MEANEGAGYPDYYEEKSDEACPSCGGEMNKGEEECAGICMK